MNKADLKKLIKPLIKECISEVLIEQGIINIIKENADVQSVKVNYEENERNFLQKNNLAQNKKQNLQETKKKLLKQVGMSGFDPFDGSEPLPEDDSNQFHEEGVQEGRLLAGIQGSGVDITRLMNANKESWNFYNKALEKAGKNKV